ACERQERYEDALKAFDFLIEKHSASVHRLQAVFERGQCLLMLKNFDAAKQAFETVLKERGEARFAQAATQHLAAIATNSKDFGRAAELYQIAAERLPESEAAEALLHQGEALLAAGKYADAEQTLRKCIAGHLNSER